MPVSVVCESSANVNAALRESLGQSCSAAAADDGKAGGVSMSSNNDDCIQSKLIASAKRVLLSKIDYEEVSNYGQSVLDSLKSKYFVLKPSTPGNGLNSGNNFENGANGSSGSNNHRNNNNRNGHSNGNAAANPDTTNGNTQNTKRNNVHTINAELPEPKRVLFPRENIRIGWKNIQHKWNTGVGMTNSGNTCYLNSTLQAVFHVPSLAQWLLYDSQHRCEGNSDAGCIICAMAKTLHESQISSSAIRPYFVYSKLKYICKHLVQGRQEDAHEFLRYLVEAMEKSYLSRFRNLKDLDQYSKETTPLNQILGGYLKSSVCCLSCGHVSVTFQHFQDLLLDIRKVDTVDDALESYFSRERLEDMGYKCEACKKKVSATKQFSLERAPIALCIQLKRFTMIGTKINKHIGIKQYLDLSSFASPKSNEQQPKLKYRLVSMVTHLGTSQHCGHYTAIGLTESGSYYTYDDSYVRPVSLQNVCNTNAYIIFYELEIEPPRRSCSTQVSSADTKENYQVKVNGYIDTQRGMIGPQLPPTGLNNYTTAAPVTANKSSLPNGSPFNNSKKLGHSRQSAGPTTSSNNNNNSSSSKIMIHFKNNSNNNASGKGVSSSTTCGTATATSTSQNGNNNKFLSQNGLHSGTGKFQESTHAKSALVSPSNKGQTTATANGNESSCCFTDGEVSSSTTNPNSERVVSTQPALPNMPLFENSTVTERTRSTAHSPLLTPLKSLVPYETEESEEDEIESKRGKCTTTTEQNLNARNALKRRNSTGSTSHSSTDAYDDDENKNDYEDNSVKIKRANSTTMSSTKSFNGNGAYSQSKPRQKTYAIDEIFHFNKRNTTANSNNNNGKNHTHHSPSKSIKHKSHFAVSSTTPATDIEDIDVKDSNATYSQSPFNRSDSAPPSPPVIKTKAGLWQVTPLNPHKSHCKISTSESALKAQTTSPFKNHKNPFSCKTLTSPELSMKRTKLNDKPRPVTFTGNGYQRDAAGDGAVTTQLLKQSHRGYGAPVLTWNGDQTEIEKEIIAETREQRQRDWEDEEETDMDRGRQKKTKAFNNNHKEFRTPGYNPFQEQQESQRARWKHGGGNARHMGQFRHQFQRNKYKYQRFNHKYQPRLQHRNNNGNGSAYSNRRNS